MTLNKNEFHGLKPRMQEFLVGRYCMSYLVGVLNILTFFLSITLLVQEHIVISLIGAILLGIQMTHAYSIMHECTHGTFVASTLGNKIWGFLSGFLCLYPYKLKQYEHMLHHRNTGGRDEPVTHKATRVFSKKNALQNHIMSTCWAYWIPVFTINELFLIWYSALTHVNKTWRTHAWIAMPSYFIIGALIVSLAGSAYALFYLALSIYLYAMALEFFTMPHHITTPIDDRHGSVPYYEQAEYSVSCVPWPKPFDTLFMLNFNYHTVHHVFPQIHWTRLREAHEIYQQHDKNMAPLKTEWEIMVAARRAPFMDIFRKYYQLSE